MNERFTRGRTIDYTINMNPDTESLPVTESLYAEGDPSPELSPDEINRLTTLKKEMLAQSRYDTSYDDLSPDLQEKIDLLSSGVSDREDEGITVLRELNDLAYKRFGQPLDSLPAEQQEILRQIQRNENTQAKEAYKNINNIEDLVDEIMSTDEDMWGEEGKFPMYMRHPESGEKVINQANLLRWVRDRMMYFHQDDPDSHIQNMAAAIAIEKPIRTILLKNVLDNERRFFRDRSGSLFYQELANQIRRELWLFPASRNMDVQYRSIMGRESDLPGEIAKMFYNNTFTKNAYGRSTMYWVMSLPQQFNSEPVPLKGRRSNKEPGPMPIDTKVGDGIRTALLAYYHIADFEMLQKVLSKKGGKTEDVPLFSRKDFIRMLSKHNQAGSIDYSTGGSDNTPEDIAQKLKESKRDREIVALTKEDWDDVNKIFRKDGKINIEAFTDYVNIFNEIEKPIKGVAVVRELIQESITKKHDIKVDINVKDEQGRLRKERVDDDLYASYAENWAYSMTRWTGIGARNDTRARTFDAWSKPINTRKYRRRQGRDTSGGAYGNLYTIDAFPATGIDFWNGVQTEAKYNKGKYKGHHKRPIDVLLEIEFGEYEKKKLEDKLEHLVELTFPDNTMRNFAFNHVLNAFKIFGQLMDQKEMNTEDVKMDTRGRIIIPDSSLHEMKEDFIKPRRYAYSTWGQLDFSQTIRVPRGDGTVDEIPLAEVLFGKQILDVSKFWKKDPFFNKPIPRFRKSTSHVLDYEKMQLNKADLWKQSFFMYIAATIWKYRAYDSHSPRKNKKDVNKYYKMLEVLPGVIEGNGLDMKDISTKGHFATDEDIKWIQRVTETEARDLTLRETAVEGSVGLLAGIFKAFKK